MAEFHEILDKLKKDGTYTPIDMGTADQWEAATMGFQNIGPDYWNGETGRLALIAGKEKYTDPQYIAVFKELASWAPYMGNGFQAQKYPDSQNLFSLGKAAIYPAGSWDISTFRGQAQFPIGAFPTAAAGRRHAVLHLRPHRHRHGREFGVQEQGGRKEIPRMAGDAGIRRRSTPTRCRASSRSAKRRSRSRTLSRPTMVGWRKDCKSTIRNSYQILNARHAEPGERTLERLGAGDQRHDDARTPPASRCRTDLDKWYKPGK